MVDSNGSISFNLHSLRRKGHEGRLRRRRLEVPDVDGAEPVPSRMLGVQGDLVERMRDEPTRLSAFEHDAVHRHLRRARAPV